VRSTLVGDDHDEARPSQPTTAADNLCDFPSENRVHDAAPGHTLSSARVSN